MVDHEALYEEACEWAYQRAREEGDVDIDYDYTIMETWQDQYYRELCKERGVEPDARYILFH